MNTSSLPDHTKAPEYTIYLRSYEDKDTLYFEDYCRGLGDPDYYGYPLEPEGSSDSGRQDYDPKPF
jgi:hypothetical protein